MRPRPTTVWAASHRPLLLRSLLRTTVRGQHADDGGEASEGPTKDSGSLDGNSFGWWDLPPDDRWEISMSLVLAAVAWLGAAWIVCSQFGSVAQGRTQVEAAVSASRGGFHRGRASQRGWRWRLAAALSDGDDGGGDDALAYRVTAAAANGARGTREPALLELLSLMLAPVPAAAGLCWAGSAACHFVALSFSCLSQQRWC